MGAFPFPELLQIIYVFRLPFYGVFIAASTSTLYIILYKNFGGLQMTRRLLTISRVLAFFVRPNFFWKEERKLTASNAEDKNKTFPAFEDENQITHARLYHFAEQIGCWNISSATEKEVGGGNSVAESSSHRSYRLIQNFRR